MQPDFTRQLLTWNKRSNTRKMPWKGEKDPYKIWLSEIILQQTRVEQGLAYYENFIRHFPTIHDLAKAPEKKVFKLWEGLGYYSRCKNLHATAKKIAHELDGVFPNTYDTIKELKGVGPYTAAAIASFAFNQPHAVVDGNVQRVIARYFGINTPIDTTAGKKLYQELAQSLLDHKQAGVYNQAIMDFGAVICKPQLPLCAQCIQNKDCEAYKLDVVNQLPVKEKTLQKKKRWFYYFIVEVGDQVYIRKRTGKDIWENLHEFILLETGQPLEVPAGQLPFLQELFLKEPFTVNTVSTVYRQTLTHQQIAGQFITIQTPRPLSLLTGGYKLVNRKSLKHYAFPRFINSFLQDPGKAAQLF